ncbi:Retrovirus-related Pol polyprotein from transposon TNT 1-94 [Includes: Protease, partial [Durusdinium trenchii]
MMFAAESELAVRTPSQARLTNVTSPSNHPILILPHMAASGLMSNRVKKSRIRSEADSEALENHWYHFTRKMIIMHGGPRALERLGKTIYQGDFTPSRADASGVMKLPACQRPKEYEVKGANQHGTWTRCSLCQTKTSYVKYSKDNPPPAVRRNKSAAVETYVSAQPMPRTPMASGSAALTSALMPDLEQLLQGQTQQLTQSTAAVMSQVMSPVVEGFHQALRYQAEEMQRSQERQETQIQQLFLAQQRIMRQTDPACQPGAAFPMMSQEELHRRMAQSLAMAQGYPLPPDEEEWDRVSENMSGDQLIFLVKDAELVDDLVCGDYPEGREAHLTKKQKQLLLNSLERISTEFSHGSKNPAESTSSEKSDKKSQEPEGHQEQSQESHDRSRNLQEPESHSRVREHFAATLSEGEREDREIISRPIRSSRSNPPSSSELRALGFTDVRPCSHGDVMEKSATPQKVMELFSPPRVSIKAVAQGLTLTEPSNFDLTEGWDALNYQHRQDMWKVLREQKPDVVIMSPERAQVYPEDMVQTVIDGILAGPVEFSGVAADDHDLMDEEAEDQEEAEPQPRTPGTLQRDSSVLLTEEQKKKILRMHLNMGHLSKEQMLSMLKAAGAREGVLKFVKEKFGCTYCMRQRKPVERRHATIPRTFSFNRIIGLDFFYLSFGGRTFAFLNAVCHGTNFQQVGMLKNYDGGVPSSKETWSLFSKIWIQPFGIPETMVCDGGSEFKQHFERAAEQQGILQIITDAASPWQNGRVERHGGWVKDRAELEINSGQTVLTDSHDLEELILATVSCKNRWYSRGGYSPCQLVFGVNPRVPTELLSDDALQELGWEEIECDAFDQDTATAAYNRSHQIRQKARQLCIEAACRDRIKSSIKQRTHKQRQWAVGQWVHVWRKFPGTGQGHLTRARWTGPGVVVLQAGHTVWVSMRARLWKCNSDQLRPATHHESIGADMARSGELQDLIAQGRSTKAGAVDVTTEGTPDDTGDGKVPSIEIDKPMVQESIAHDLRTADTAKDIESEGQHLPLRQVSVPRPVIPEETEGSVADTVSEATAGSKRKSRHSDQDSASNKKKIVEETVVKRPVEDQEQANLEKIALKTLRRLEREEKMRKISERKEAVASASSETPNQETTSSSSSMALQQPSTETSADGFAPQDALMAELTEQGLSFLELKIEDSCLMTKPVKTKSQEFDMKLATDEEKKGFKASDEAEWKTILDLKAVEVLNPAESRKVRRDHPHRILPSRFVRRKKPMPGLGQWKFKSRWCVLGHCDPDTGSYSTYSPMPMTESISIFFQLCTNMDMSVTFCDVTQAFCQSEPLDRPEGDLYVEACEGLVLPEGTVIRLVAPVYGLEDAPLRWHQTVINFLRSLGFERSLLEPCWYVRRDARNEVEAMILVEVDDLNVATRKDVKDELLSALNQRFRFGKMEYDEADFAGRHVRVLPGRIEMNQEKYIIEKLHPLKLPLGRKGDKSSRLKPDEFEAFRSMLYKVAWVAHQTRPEAAGVVSILSSRLKEGTIEDVSCLNKLIQHLRNTAQQSLTLHRFSNDKMILIAASDAGGVDSLPPDKSSEIDNVQGAWIIMAADRLPSANQRIKVSILSWRSSKLRRRVASTLASEALAFSQSLSEVEWIQIMIRDIIKGDVKRTDWTESLTPYVPVLKENCELAEKLEQCHVTDAKSLFDALKKESPMSRQDRRTSVELSIILEALQKARSVIRWAPHPRMVADGLTKADITRTNGALEELLRTSRLTLWDEKQELNLRKDDPAAKGRSRRASTRHRSLEASEESFALLSRINKNLG